MKVDKYDVATESGNAIWILVEHGTDMDRFEMPAGYGINGFIESFTLEERPEINYEQALDRLKVKGCYYGTTFSGCSVK